MSFRTEPKASVRNPPRLLSLPRGFLVACAPRNDTPSVIPNRAEGAGEESPRSLSLPEGFLVAFAPRNDTPSVIPNQAEGAGEESPRLLLLSGGFLVAFAPRNDMVKSHQFGDLLFEALDDLFFQAGDVALGDAQLVGDVLLRHLLFSAQPEAHIHDAAFALGQLFQRLF